MMEIFKGTQDPSEWVPNGQGQSKSINKYPLVHTDSNKWFHKQGEEDKSLV